MGVASFMSFSGCLRFGMLQSRAGSCTESHLSPLLYSTVETQSFLPTPTREIVIWRARPQLPRGRLQRQQPEQSTLPDVLQASLLCEFPVCFSYIFFHSFLSEWSGSLSCFYHHLREIRKMPLCSSIIYFQRIRYFKLPFAWLFISNIEEKTVFQLRVIENHCDKIQRTWNDVSDFFWFVIHFSNT